jgi:hypothetical protein
MKKGASMNNAFGIIFYLFFSFSVLAQDGCTEQEKGFAFFDVKKSSWIEDESIQVLKCKDGIEIIFSETKSKKILNKITIPNPSADERLYLDGMSCNEKNEKRKDIFRNKIIQGSGLKINKAWAVNFKSKKLEKLMALNLWNEP